MVEVIGYIISLLALIYLLSKQSKLIQQQRKSHPQSRGEEGETREDDPFKDFLRSIEDKMEPKETLQLLPPPPPAKKREHPKKVLSPSREKSQLKISIEGRHLKSPLERDLIKSKFNHQESLPGRTLALSMAYHQKEQHEKQRPSRFQLAVKNLANRHDMVIYQEIMGKPKSLQSEAFYP